VAGGSVSLDPDDGGSRFCDRAVVTREKQRATRPLRFGEQSNDLVRPGRVETGGRLVDDQQVG
jgi:hypothetical protein